MKYFLCTVQPTLAKMEKLHYFLDYPVPAKLLFQLIQNVISLAMMNMAGVQMKYLTLKGVVTQNVLICRKNVNLLFGMLFATPPLWKMSFLIPKPKNLTIPMQALP